MTSSLVQKMYNGTTVVWRHLKTKANPQTVCLKLYCTINTCIGYNTFCTNIFLEAWYVGIFTPSSKTFMIHESFTIEPSLTFFQIVVKQCLMSS